MKWTKAKRDALPAADFGDPERRLFPVADQDDVDSAARLIGKAADPEAVKRRIIAIAKRKGLTVPDAWQQAKHSAFSADLATFGETGGMVLRRGKLFEAGEYPDKAYAMTPEELLAAVADFQPVALDLEHTPTVLDGKLGELRAVELGEDGWSLYGTVALPRWLDEQLGGECKVSCTWDRERKTLQKLALVNEPRVSDAAIMAAFAAQTRHDTADGQSTLQYIHDQAARAGAICDVNNARRSPDDVLPTAFKSQHEAGALQQIHDLATTHGARCSALSADGARLSAAVAAFVSKRHSTADAADIQQIHDLAARQGADCATKGATMSEQTSRWDQFKAWLTGEDGQSAPFATTVTTEAKTATPPAESAETQALRERLAALEAERIADRAVAFAEAEIRAARALPAERAALVAAYTQAALDDQALGGQVTFAVGADTKSGTRVEALTALCGARQPHQLTTEFVRQREGVGVVANTARTTGSAEQPMSEERRRELLSKLPEGRAILAERQNGH